MSNFPHYLEGEVNYCADCGHRWLGNKECPECAGMKTANVHYEHYTVNLRAYKRLYSKHPELWDAQGT